MSFSEPELALALYDFQGEREGDLAFKRGDIIEIVSKSDSGWWVGSLNDLKGVFPYNFVKLL